MIMLLCGKSVIWAWSLSYGISYCIDTEISPPYPESWGAGVCKQTFPQSIKGNAGVRDS